MKVRTLSPSYMKTKMKMKIHPYHHTITIYDRHWYLYRWSIIWMCVINEAHNTDLIGIQNV